MNESNQTGAGGELTLKELLTTTREYFGEVRRNWKIVLFFILPFLCFFLFQAFTTPKEYPSILTFMVNEEDGGDNGVGAILGQFGFGGGSSGEYNLAKIVELSRSRRIISEALFEKGEVDGQEDFFANHIIRQYKFHEKWEDDKDGLANFLFSHGVLDSFNRIENKALQRVYKKVKGNAEEGVKGLMKSQYQEETSILSLSLSTRSEDLSIQFLLDLYDKLSIYYIFENTEKPKTTYDNLKEKVDSLRGALESKEVQLAQMVDANRSVFSKSALLRQKRLEREAGILTIAYGKAIENLEVADFTIKNATPFFQVIDYPIAPIKPVEKSILKALVFSFLLGGVFGTLFILGRKIIRDSMES